jgi:nickel transport protein
VIRILCLLLSLFCRSVSAHDHWLERETGTYTLFQGHRHSAHAGAETLAYPPENVKTALCLETTGNIRTLAPGKTYPVSFTANCSALLVSIASGYWTKTVSETVNKPKTGLAGVTKSWFSEESVKRIDGWSNTLASPLGSGLEISPLTDPFRVAIDEKLTVVVSENRKPKAGVAVAYQGDTRGVTDVDGRIAIRIRHSGLQLITASSETPLEDGKADTLIRATALQFELTK